MLKNGSIQLNVARQFNVAQYVISRLWNRHQQTGNVTDFPPSGRPRSTTRRQDHLPVTNALGGQISNATQLQQQQFHAPGVRVTSQTVKNNNKKPIYILLSCILVVRTLYCH